MNDVNNHADKPKLITELKAGRVVAYLEMASQAISAAQLHVTPEDFEVLKEARVQLVKVWDSVTDQY